MIHQILLAPFELGFMRRALAGCIALSLAGPPLGVFLVLRRMSLMSDVLQHGILPGIALGAMFGGLSYAAMGAGGVVAGLAVATLAGWLTRATGGREDSQLAGVYLLALAAGVSLVSAQRGIDLTHLLFGSVLAVDNAALISMGAVATLALLGLALIWRPLILESFDPDFLRAAGGRGGVWHLAFMALVVLSVVGGFAALGTLMSVGLMMLPAIAARHFSASLPARRGRPSYWPSPRRGPGCCCRSISTSRLDRPSCSAPARCGQAASRSGRAKVFCAAGCGESLFRRRLR